MSGLEPVAYNDGAIGLTGWLAQPQGVPRAAVVVFPTIVNVNPAMERRARMLAEAGYLAMIADFYGEAVANFEASGPLAQKLRSDPHTYRARLRAAIAALGSLPDAAGLPMAAIG
ncbi:MAG: dienelactone hydrolase family protein, partial [Novosphingobium sp.]